MSETPKQLDCGCGWFPGDGMYRYCDEHNPCFPTSMRNKSKKPAPVVAEVRRAKNLPDARLLELWREVSGPHAGLTGPLIRFAGKVLEADESALRTRLRGLEQQWRKLARQRQEVAGGAQTDLSRYTNLASSQAGTECADELARLLTTPEEPK